MESMREKAIRIWDETEAGLDVRHAAYNRDPASQWLEPFEICDGLYYVGDKVVCMHLLETGDGLVLFDSGLPHAVDQLLSNIERLGFRLQDVAHVFHTHEHFDHFGATPYLQDTYGSRTYLHEAGVDVFENHRQQTEIQSAPVSDARLFRPDVAFSDGDSFTIGRRTIECVHTPGHSDGATTFFFNLQETGADRRVGLCGITGVMTLHLGRLYKYGIDPSFRDEYVRSIEAMKKVSVDITLDTHPRPDGVLERRAKMLWEPGANPFIDPEVWNRSLDDYLDRYRAFLAREKDLLSS